MKGKLRTFNGLSGFIKGEDKQDYHFDKVDFRNEEFFRLIRKLFKRKLLSKVEINFIPKDEKIIYLKQQIFGLRFLKSLEKIHLIKNLVKCAKRMFC